jgi:hypothetical protein
VITPRPDVAEGGPDAYDLVGDLPASGGALWRRQGMIRRKTN